MRSRLLLGILAVGILALSVPSSHAAESSERMAKLEELMELAVDRFELNRFAEARAALAKLVAENPTNEEAYLLRQLFGQRILLEMQKYGLRPVLTRAEKVALVHINEALLALDKNNPKAAAEAMQKVIDAFQEHATADVTPVGQQRATLLLADIQSLEGKNLSETSGRRAKRQLMGEVGNWREELQSLGSAPLMLLTRASRFERNELMKPEKIRSIVKSAVMDPEGAQRYLLDISRLGAFAVPELLVHVSNDKNTAARNNATFILITLGQEAVMPLVEALSSTDEVLLSQICQILSEIRPRDARAIPALKRLYDNKEVSGPVHVWAGKALETITGSAPETLKPAADYYYLEANRYYLGGQRVENQLTAMQNTIWVWDPEAPAGDKKGNVRPLTLPDFMMAQMLAEELIYDGMALTTEKRPFQVLLASLFLQQKNEVDLLAKVIALQDITRPDVAQVSSQLTEWKDRLNRNARAAYTMGDRFLGAALDKAMYDGKVDVAVSAMEGLTVLGRDTGWASIGGYAPMPVMPSKTAAPAPKVAKALAPKQVERVPMPEPVIPCPTDTVVGETVTKIYFLDENGEKVFLDPTSGEESGVMKILESEEPMSTKTGSTGDAPVPMKDASSGAVAGKSAGHPLLTALNHPNVRVRVAAANCLLRIGLPVTHPAYAKLLPILVEGALSKKATIAMVVSDDPAIRTRMANALENEQVLVMTASGGQQAYALATQYPPKDAILIDAGVDQFDQLRLRLALQDISLSGLLPLTIITSRNHVDAITKQFVNEKLATVSNEAGQDANQYLNEEERILEQDKWRVRVRHNIKADNDNLYRELETMQRHSRDNRTVILLTADTRAERWRIKEMLQLTAERAQRPDHLTELAELQNRDRVLGDVFGARETFVPVFVDEELAGYDAMGVVQQLYTDPRTRPVPIAILAKPEYEGESKTDFEQFIKDDHVRILSQAATADTLVKAVEAMKTMNPLSKNHHAREVTNMMALNSADALTMLNLKDGALKLSESEEKALAKVVEDKTRPNELRIAAAAVLGHFKADTILESLKGVFRNEDLSNIALRAAVLRAIGDIDTTNTEMEFKLKAMNEPYREIQEAAAAALGPAAQNLAQRETYLQELRPNDPLKLVRGVDSGAPALKESATVSVTTTTTTPAVSTDGSEEEPEEPAAMDEPDEPEDEPEEVVEEEDWDSGFEW